MPTTIEGLKAIYTALGGSEDDFTTAIIPEALILIADQINANKAANTAANTEAAEG